MSQSAHPPKKILVIALDNLGDAVMASAILRPLSTLFPQANIGLWVKKYAADLFVDHSLLDHLHAADPFWDKSPGVAKGGALAFAKVLSEIRKTKYDLAVVLNAEWRRSVCAELAGIPMRIGFNRRKSGPFLTHSFDAPRELQHFVDDHRTLLERYFKKVIPVDHCLPRIELTAEDERLWSQLSQEHNIRNGEYTVLHTFSGDEDKNWPLSCWVELVERRLANSPDEKFVILCGPGEEVKLEPYRQRLLRSGVQLMPAPSLKLMKGLLAHARLLMGGDSGPGHVAAALGTPVLSLFGPTHPARSAPKGHGAIKIVNKNPLRSLLVEDVLAEMASNFSHV